MRPPLDSTIGPLFLVRASGDPSPVGECQEGNRLLITTVTAQLRASGLPDADAAREARLLATSVQKPGAHSVRSSGPATP